MIKKKKYFVILLQTLYSFTLLYTTGDLSKKKSPTGLQKTSTKPKLKTAKVEKVEMNDYSYEIYSEEFQNDGEDYQEFMADKEAERRKVLFCLLQ